MKKLEVIVIGAGQRGKMYSGKMSQQPDKYEIVAVADKIDSRRNSVRDRDNIPDNMCFSDWRDLLALGKIADIAIIATMDKQHYEPAMEALRLGYNLLLEKPVSINPKECVDIANCAREHGAKVVVCHVLRYSRLFSTLKEMLDAGKIGEIVGINHEECVGNIHHSHSYVRGNWGNEERSSFMLLAKSCHDLDIIQWLLGKKCKKIQSFGALTYFTSANAPANAPEYCINGCPEGDSCPYNAIKLYYDDKGNGWFREHCTGQFEPDDEAVEKALRTTQYGKCVFKCDNDVVDHQTVNMLFEDDVTATFTMNSLTKGGRFIHIMGTEGEIHAAINGNVPIECYNFKTKETETIPLTGMDGVVGGHGGGDDGIIKALYEYMTDCYHGKELSNIQISCENHLMAFAAEQSRLEGGKMIDMDEYIKSLNKII